MAAAELLEGRIAILVDGTPFVLIVPTLFISFFQTAEDYYQRADISTLLRIIRFISLFIAMVGPAIYIAITTFHQELLPTQLLISLAALEPADLKDTIFRLPHWALSSRPRLINQKNVIREQMSPPAKPKS